MSSRSTVVWSNLIGILLMNDFIIMRMSRRTILYIASLFAMANIGNVVWPSDATTRLIVALVINLALVVTGGYLWGVIVLRTAKVLARANEALGVILSDVEAEQTHRPGNR